MIPRLPPEVMVKEETRQLVLDLAENLYPGVDEIGKLDKPNRGYWLLLSSGILREYPDISHYLDTLSDVLARGVNAEIDDILHRLAADLKEKQRRSEAEEHERGNREQREERLLEAELEDKAQLRGERQERWEMEREERTQRLQKQGRRDDNGLLVERILMVMMVVAFVLAVVFLVVGALAGEGRDQSVGWTNTGWVFAAGGSGAMGLLSLIMLMLYRVMPGKRAEPPSPQAAEAPASAGP
jgi:hypothetical protein